MNFESVMSYGLNAAGFVGARQNVSDKLKMKRFRSHFGIGPSAIIAMVKDLNTDTNNKKNNKNMLKHIMMTLCWFKLYETKHVMKTVRSIAYKIQCLKAKKKI